MSHRSAFVDGLLVTVLRAALNDSVTIGTQQPGDLDDKLPFLVAHKTTGGGLHPRFAGRAGVDLDGYASDNNEAFTLVDNAVAALLTAQERQTVTVHGYISHLEETESPFRFPDDVIPDRIVRYHASLQLVVRPAP